MSKQDEQWQRLAKLARQAPKVPEPEMPYGFATRVVAQWPKVSAEPALEIIWEKFALRFLGIAFAIMAITVSLTYSTLAEESHALVTMTESVLGTAPVIEP